jgi:hypothetical protein
MLRLPVSIALTPLKAACTVGREGREGLGDPGGEVGRAKGLPRGRVVEREGGTAT